MQSHPVGQPGQQTAAIGNAIGNGNHPQPGPSNPPAPSAPTGPTQSSIPLAKTLLEHIRNGTLNNNTLQQMYPTGRGPAPGDGQSARTVHMVLSPSPEPERSLVPAQQPTSTQQAAQLASVLPQPQSQNQGQHQPQSIVATQAGHVPHRSPVVSMPSHSQAGPMAAGQHPARPASANTARGSQPNPSTTAVRPDSTAVPANPRVQPGAPVARGPQTRIHNPQYQPTQALNSSSVPLSATNAPLSAYLNQTFAVCAARLQEVMDQFSQFGNLSVFLNDNLLQTQTTYNGNVLALSQERDNAKAQLGEAKEKIYSFQAEIGRLVAELAKHRKARTQASEQALLHVEILRTQALLHEKREQEMLDMFALALGDAPDKEFIQGQLVSWKEEAVLLQQWRARLEKAKMPLQTLQSGTKSPPPPVPAEGMGDWTERMTASLVKAREVAQEKAESKRASDAAKLLHAQTEVYKLGKKLEAKETEIRDLKAQISSSLEAKAEMEKVNKEKFDRLEKDVESLQEEKRQLEAHVDRLGSDLRDQCKLKGEAEQGSKALEERVRAVERERANALAASQLHRSEAESLRKEVKAKVAELEAKEADLQAKVADLKAKDADLKAKDVDLKAKDADLKAKDVDLKAKDADLKALQERINNYKALEKTLQERIDKYKAQETRQAYDAGQAFATGQTASPATAAGVPRRAKAQSKPSKPGTQSLDPSVPSVKGSPMVASKVASKSSGKDTANHPFSTPPRTPPTPPTPPLAPGMLEQARKRPRDEQDSPEPKRAKAEGDDGETLSGIELERWTRRHLTLLAVSPRPDAVVCKVCYLDKKETMGDERGKLGDQPALPGVTCMLDDNAITAHMIKEHPLKIARLSRRRSRQGKD